MITLRDVAEFALILGCVAAVIIFGALMQGCNSTTYVAPAEEQSALVSAAYETTCSQVVCHYASSVEVVYTNSVTSTRCQWDDATFAAQDHRFVVITFVRNTDGCTEMLGDPFVVEAP